MNRTLSLAPAILAAALAWPAAAAPAALELDDSARGDEILRRMAAKLNRGIDEPIRSLAVGFTMIASIGGEPISMTQELSVVLPDKTRQVVKTPLGEQVLVFNGTRGVAMSELGSVPIPPERVAEALESLALDLLVLASHAGSPELKAVAAGSDEWDGVGCDLVSVSFMGAESRLCVDPTGTVLFQRHQGKHPLEGNPGVMEVFYSDYRELDGRLVPYTRLIRFEGQDLVKMTLDSMAINPDLSPDLFDLPEE